MLIPHKEKCNVTKVSKLDTNKHEETYQKTEVCLSVGVIIAFCLWTNSYLYVTETITCKVSLTSSLNFNSKVLRSNVI